MQTRVLPWFISLVINAMFPVYLVTRYGTGWDSAMAAGWQWLFGFFFLSLATLALNFSLIRALLARPQLFPGLEPQHHKNFMLLFAVHNAGYIPLPIMEAVGPPEVTVYMFSYILAFNLVFWSVAVSIILHEREDGENRFRIRLRLNPPLVGIFLGLFLAATGLYDHIPEGVRRMGQIFSRYAMQAVLVVLGGILAGIPHDSIWGHREFRSFVMLKSFALPAAVLGFSLALRSVFSWGDVMPSHPMTIDEPWRWLQLVLVLEAVTPPATNLGIAMKRYGNATQLNYTGSGLMISYIGAIVALPLFTFLAITL